MIDLELARQEFNKLHTRKEGTQPSYGDEALQNVLKYTIMKTNLAQTMYKASWKEENTILDNLWCQCSDAVIVRMDGELLVLDNVTDVDRPIIKKALAEAGCSLIEIVDDKQDGMYDLLLEARNILHKREDLDSELIKVHDYLDIVLDSWK